VHRPKTGEDRHGREPLCLFEENRSGWSVTTRNPCTASLPAGGSFSPVRAGDRRGDGDASRGIDISVAAGTEWLVGSFYREDHKLIEELRRNGPRPGSDAPTWAINPDCDHTIFFCDHRLRRIGTISSIAA
jgi:hypothetical protein